MVIADINYNTESIYTSLVPSAYYKTYIPTFNTEKLLIEKKSILVTELISEDANKPCYKTSIKNIKNFLHNKDIYKNSLNKNLIEENLNRSFCGFGVSANISKTSMMNKIKDSVLIYKKLNVEEKNNLNNMNSIFFTVLREIDGRLS